MEKDFCGATRENVLAHAMEKFQTVPEYLWMKFPSYAVLRRADNKKWYAIIMDVSKEKLGLIGKERTDILNIKCDSALRAILTGQEGFLPAYHLNRENWITVLLDGSVDRDAVFGLLDESYEIARGKGKRQRSEPTSFLVPVNPKYFDVPKAFAENDTILWKQSNSVVVGDTVYLYFAAPISCILYRCVVVEADIPYEYDDGNVRMHKVMKIKRLNTFKRGMFDVSALKAHGIVSVRGPRSVPYGLRYELEKESENGT